MPDVTAFWNAFDTVPDQAWSEISGTTTQSIRGVARRPLCAAPLGACCLRA